MSVWVSFLIVGVAVGNLPVTAKPQESVSDYCRRAQELLAQEKFQDAREAALHALDIDSHSAEAECLLGMAEFALGNFEGAGKDLEKALELKPGLLPAHRTLGEMYLNQKRMKDARHQFDLVLASYPNDFESLYGLGLTFLLEHQPGPAESEFDLSSEGQAPGTFAPHQPATSAVRTETGCASGRDASLARQPARQAGPPANGIGSPAG